MFVRKSLLLASIAAVGVSVATAQQAGIDPRTASAMTGQISDPFAAPAPQMTSGSAPEAIQSPAIMQAQVEALAFGAPPLVASTAPAVDAMSFAAAPAPIPTGYAPQQQVVTVTPPAGGIGAAAITVPGGFDIGTPVAVVRPTPTANPFAPPVAAPQPAAGAAQPGAPAAAFSIEAAKPDPAAEAKSPTDETALRYYASERDLVRVGAEIRRLKTLYPNWQAPSDLFAPRGGADEQPLWDLYAKGDYASIRNAIEDIKVSKANWTPSLDLMTKLEDGEVRQKVRAAAASGDWTSAIAAVQERPSLLVCANMDVLWTVGEGFARNGNLARAFDLYAYVLGNCDVPQERLATFQKAGELLPPQGIEALVSYGRVLPDGQGEFDSLRFDGVRKKMAEVASGGTSMLPPGEELKAYADFVRSSRSANDMGLVGWYFYGQQDWDRATEWFRAGMDVGGDSKLIEGYVLSLRNGDKIAEAEQAAYKTYRMSPELTKIYVEMIAEELTADDASNSVDDELVDRFETVVKDTKSPLGAQAIGWRLIQGEDFEDAQEWFERSVEWKPTEEGVVGLAVVATRLKQNSELKQIKARYSDDFPVLSDFKDYTPAVSSKNPTRQASAARPAASSKKKGGNKKAGGSKGGGGGDSLMAEANSRFDSGDYEGALEALDKREARRGKEYGAEILRGWSNHKLQRWEKAREVFTAQDRKRSTKDTRFGIGATSNSQYRMWPDSQNKCTKWGKC